MVVADGAPEEFQVNSQLFGVNPLVALFVEPAPPCTQRAPCQLRGSVGRLEPAAAAPVEDALHVLELLGRLGDLALGAGEDERCLHAARHSEVEGEIAFRVVLGGNVDCFSTKIQLSRLYIW